MINDYYEYKHYLDECILKNVEVEAKCVNRLINLLARRFIYINIDKDGNFDNDYYKLVDKTNNDKYRHCKKRLRYSKGFINYLLTGKIEIDKKTNENPNGRPVEEKFKEYLTNHFSKDGLTKNEINSIFELREKSVKKDINLVSKKVSTNKIEFANLDAVIEGPLRKNVGIKFTKEQILKICKLSTERNKKGTLQYNYIALAIMLVSYYFYYFNNTNKKTIPFTVEHHRQLHKDLGNYFYRKNEKPGFASMNLLAVENITEGTINGVHLSNTENSDKIFDGYIPEIVIVKDSDKVFYPEDDSKQYYIYLDKGETTFKELKIIMKDFCKENGVK